MGSNKIEMSVLAEQVKKYSLTLPSSKPHTLSRFLLDSKVSTDFRSYYIIIFSDRDTL